MISDEIIVVDILGIVLTYDRPNMINNAGVIRKNIILLKLLPSRECQ